jgi:hypothetical protein
MLRPPLQGLQNQQVQRSLQEFNAVLVPRLLLDHRFVPRFIPSVPLGFLESLAMRSFCFRPW